ncbi:MAG: hypothetical protein OXD46_10885 [Chloroflexi bacterium]|nr:hypothetical protein [Chloroflexota bacterium]
MTDSKRIVLNDDGWIMSQIMTPVTTAVLKERIVDTYVDSGLDTLSWCIGDTGRQRYETVDILAQPHHLPQGRESDLGAQNLRRLIDSDGGPVTIFTKLCHEIGIKFLPSVRMNSHYDRSVADDVGTLRSDHPEYLIGQPDEEFIPNTTQWGIRTGLDYARPEVRSHVAALVIDLFERFDTDGVELDFMRHPAFFRVDEAFGSRHLITDMLLQIRARMDEVSDSTGRDLEILVRVPPTIADSARIGLDVETWIQEGIVDAVAAGGGFIPLHAPVEEFVEVAERTDCQILGAIESLRPATEEESVNAIASRLYEDGASGLYLFNFWHKSADWKRRVLNVLTDPDQLARATKRYEMEFMERLTPNDLHSYAFRYAVPAVQLPVDLGFNLTGRGPVLSLTIGDDIEKAEADGEIAWCMLALGLSDLTAEDELDVLVNGVLLPSESVIRRFGTWSRQEWTKFPERLDEVDYEGGVVEYEIEGPPFRRGENEIEVRTTMRTVMRATKLSLRHVELQIEYDN